MPFDINSFTDEEGAPWGKKARTSVEDEDTGLFLGDKKKDHTTGYYSKKSSFLSSSSSSDRTPSFRNYSSEFTGSHKKHGSPKIKKEESSPEPPSSSNDEEPGLLRSHLNNVGSGNAYGAAPTFDDDDDNDGEGEDYATEINYLKEYYVDPPRHPTPTKNRSQMPLNFRVDHDAGNKKNRIHQGSNIYSCSYSGALTKMAGLLFLSHVTQVRDFVYGSPLAEQLQVIRRTQAKFHYVREINDSIAHRHKPNRRRKHDGKEQMPADGLYYELDTSGETEDELKKCLLWKDDKRYAPYYLIQKRGTDIKPYNKALWSLANLKGLTVEQIEQGFAFVGDRHFKTSEHINQIRELWVQTAHTMIKEYPNRFEPETALARNQIHLPNNWFRAFEVIRFFIGKYKDFKAGGFARKKLTIHPVVYLDGEIETGN